MALPIFTIQSFNQSVLQPVGAVFAQRVESVSIPKSTFAGFSSPNTGRSTAMEKKMNDLTKALLSEINSQAKATYPNAVALVDLNLHFSNIGKNGDNTLLAGEAAATVLIKRKVSVVPMPIPSQPMAMASQPMPVAAPSQPVAMAAPMAMAAPVAMAMAPPEPMASQPMAMAGPALVPQQGARRNRRRTVNRNKRNRKTRKNRR